MILMCLHLDLKISTIPIKHPVKIYVFQYGTYGSHDFNSINLICQK